jgi:hypothetical protein
MHRFPLRIALTTLAALALMASATAPAAQPQPRDLTPHPADITTLRTTDVFHLRTTAVFEGRATPVYDEWFSPGSGLFNVKFSEGRGKYFRASNDGQVAFIYDQGHLRRTTGTRAFLKALAYPTVDVRPGASLLYGYLAGGTGDGLKSSVENDRLVLTDNSWQPQENNDAKVFFTTKIVERISEARAQARHLFTRPGTRDSRRLRKPGQAAAIPGLHAWWLGPSFNDERAVTAWEEKTARPESSDPHRSYTTVYASAQGTHAKRDPRDWPQWQGFGYLDSDVILIVSMARDTKIGYGKEPQIKEPVYLADGSQATLISIGPLQWIRTSNALITLGVSYGPGLASLAGSLRPVER